jgi:hypothetical protein
MLIKFNNNNNLCLYFHPSSNSVLLHFTKMLVDPVWKSKKIIKKTKQTKKKKLLHSR